MDCTRKRIWNSKPIFNKLREQKKSCTESICQESKSPDFPDTLFVDGFQVFYPEKLSREDKNTRINNEISWQAKQKKRRENKKTPKWKDHIIEF